MRQIIQEIINLLVNGVIAFVVWDHYRTRRFSESLKYSTFAPRFWTGAADTCVLWPIGFAITALALLDLGPAMGVVLMLSGQAVWLVYTVFMHARFGQTYGKMLSKVRVVDFKTENRITLKQALRRECIPIVLFSGIIGYQTYLIVSGKLTFAEIQAGALAKQDFFWLITSLPLLWFVAEVLTMLTNDKRRSLHDFIAGTVVVRTNLEV